MMKKEINNFEADISKEDIYKLQLVSFEGEIEVIEHQEEVLNAIDYLKQFNILGFDTETKPTFKKGQKNSVALLQLAASEKAFIFRLHKTGLTKEIVSLLENEQILKIGAALHDDIKSLQKHKKFEPAGFIDLQHVVKEYKIECKGLKKLAAVVLGRRISKSQQTSNWEKEELTGSQIIYAATDAWICLEIYKKLNSGLLI